MLRFLTAGESHGPALVVTVEGMPAGLPILVDDIAAELARRRLGYGRGPRMRFEQDELELLGGIRHGRTLGSPIAIVIRNSEWATGQVGRGDVVGAGRDRSSRSRSPGPATPTSRACRSTGSPTRATCSNARARGRPRRASRPARSPRRCSRQLGISVLSHVVQLGAAAASPDRRPGPDDLESIDSSEVRCCDPDAEAEMIREIKEAAKAGDSLGGVVEVLGFGIPPGLGSHVHWDRRIDGLLAQALMSIQAMKAVEIGEGLTVAGGRGSVAHDAIAWDADAGEYRRESSRAGGIEGGMTTGDLLVARVVDEAARDAEPAGAEDGRHRDQGGVGVVQGAHRRHRGARGRRGRGDDDRARARVGGAAEVRRRLARRVRAQPRRVPRVAAMSEHERAGTSCSSG